ncbi:MAG: dihydrofolate reductase family protein [Actinobacteria bacterium]|nr:dihydrofolate reductase family protein [Actinomycetota bacterium]MBV8396054.1 dihydrofolate reductase family protein [Actinomycetota bacterium]
MEAPGGEAGYAHAGWVGPYFSDELGAYREAEQLAADVLLLGRKTYDSFYGAWPHRDGAMADKINTMRKLVASRTLASSDWHDTTIVSGDVAAHVAEVKAEDGSPIIVAGSRSVVHLLLAAGLVDELHLQVFPIALGSGARFWPETADPLRFALVASTELPNGVVAQEYRL